MLKSEGLKLDINSSLYKKFHNLFRRINRELAERKISFLSTGKYKKHDKYLWRYVLSQFEKINEINIKKKEIITLKQLFERFLRDQTDAKVTKVTLKSYVAPMRAMKEILGKNTDIAEINRENIKELATFIKKLPSNAVKKFPNMSLKKIVELTENNENVPKISPETAKNYYKNIIAIFNYAVKTQHYLKDNPADDKWIRESFKFVRTQAKAQYSIEELNKIISTELFLGYDDIKNLLNRNTDKGGKFWVPLLSLYHGFRMNEACQLLTEDVKLLKDPETKKSYLSILIRPENDKGKITFKHLKNPTSKRILPVHPELMRIGFRKLWEKRKQDTDSDLLFPDLRFSNIHNNYSHRFSTWFSGFIKKILGYKAKANFHSLRHSWRDRLRAAGVDKEMAEALGGWKVKSSSEAGYGQGFTIGKKYDALKKVKYPNLKISRLHFMPGIHKYSKD